MPPGCGVRYPVRREDDLPRRQAGRACIRGAQTGMKRHLAYLAAVPALAVISCGRTGEAPPGPNGGRTRVACVGDSITYGLGLWNRGRDCYPARLGGMLGGGYEVRNFGVSGATLRENGALPYRGTRAFVQATRWNPQTSRHSRDVAITARSPHGSPRRRPPSARRCCTRKRTASTRFPRARPTTPDAIVS